MRAAILTGWLALAVVAGCSPDTPPVEDASVPPDTFRADTGGGCEDGEIGCPCSDGMCTTGECVSGECVDCDIATDGCVCRMNGTCNAGLRCSMTTELCEPCPPGENGCECEAGDVCDTGLECDGGVCVPDTCTDGVIDCPCRASPPRCDTGAICDDGSGLCRTCTSDMPGCPCDGGACTGGLVCDTGSCRAATTCEDLVTAGMCHEFQVCTEAPGVDAVCEPMTCIADYRWRSADSTCVACVSPGCAAEPTCDPGLPNTLDCAADHRECLTVDGVAECGDCSVTYSEIAGVCVSLGMCGTDVCDPMEYCDTTNPGGPTCTPWPCPTRDQIRDTSGACTITCTRDCLVPGSTGRYWPYADLTDDCVCETVPGYYFDSGTDRIPVQCDADRDGWVRDDVRDILDAPMPDPAVIANARCDVRSAGRVELRDEYGVSSIVESCDEGLLQDRGGTGTCTPFPLRLFESKRNDVESEIVMDADSPAYGGASGRLFHAAELNGLTKGCVNAIADYDDDGTADLRQFQPVPADTSSLTSESARLRVFSHFVELYLTAWVPPTAGPNGTLVIQERSRCDDSFPFHYGGVSAGEYDPDVDETYWRTCQRRRHPAYNAAMPVPGFDFGQFSCAPGDRTGSCDGPPVPAHPTASTLPTSPVLRGHGLCEVTSVAGRRPADMRFRGMQHHSQFQCVQVIANAATPTQPYQRREQVFGDGGGTATLTSTGPTSMTGLPEPVATLTMNTCNLRDCAGVGGCVESVPGTGVDSSDPRFECTVAPLGTTPSVDTVGFAAVRYQPYGEVLPVATTPPTFTPYGDLTYNGGCINEMARGSGTAATENHEYPELCPIADFGVCNSADAEAFGRYCCYGCPDGGCQYANAFGTCNDRECHLGSCHPGFGNCDRPTPGTDDDLATSTGCEDTLDSLGSCGGCGTVCSRANAVPRCVVGDDRCEIAACNAGFDDCDSNDANGCENDLSGTGATGGVRSAANSCNMCGIACNPPNTVLSGVSCDNPSDTCMIGPTGCSTYYYDTDGVVSTGCECYDRWTSGIGTCSATGATTTNLGSVGVGGMADTPLPGGYITGSTTSSYDWYRVQFPQVTDSMGRMRGTAQGTPRIVFATGASLYRFDVFRSCSGSAMCASSGGLTSWSFTDNADGTNTYRTNGTAWPTEVFIRVRRAAAGSQCTLTTDAYQIHVTR